MSIALYECKNKAITTCSEFIKPFYNRWKDFQKLFQEELCKVVNRNLMFEAQI